MGRKTKRHDQWLEASNDDQIQWTATYLTKLVGNNVHPDYGSVMHMLNLYQGGTHHWPSIQKMRTLWSSHKYRTQKGTKIHNIALTKEASAELKHLAKSYKQTVSSVLNGIILNTGSLESAYKEGLKKEKDLMKNELNDYKRELQNKYAHLEKGLDKNLKAILDKSPMDKLRDQLFQLQFRAAVLTEGFTRYETLLHEKGLDETPLTEEQTERARNRRETLMEELFGGSWRDVAQKIEAAKQQPNAIATGTNKIGTNEGKIE